MPGSRETPIAHPFQDQILGQPWEKLCMDN